MLNGIAGGLMFAAAVMAGIVLTIGTLQLITKVLPQSPGSAALAWMAASIVAAASVICTAFFGHALWPDADWVFFIPAVAVLGALLIWHGRSTWRDVRQALEARRRLGPED